MGEAVNKFATALKSKNELENPLTQRFIQRKLHTINTQASEIKQLKEALQQQQKTLNQYAHEYYLMGNECITKAHDKAAALRCFDKALEMNPLFVDAWVRKGVTLFDNDDIVESLKCLNKAVQLSPISFKALYNRGKCLLMMRHNEEALTDFLKASAAKPKHIAAHQYLAETYIKLNNEALAQKHLEIAEALKEAKKNPS